MLSSSSYRALIVMMSNIWTVLNSTVHLYPLFPLYSPFLPMFYCFLCPWFPIFLCFITMLRDTMQSAVLLHFRYLKNWNSNYVGLVLLIQTTYRLVISIVIMNNIVNTNYLQSLPARFSLTCNCHRHRCRLVALLLNLEPPLDHSSPRPSLFSSRIQGDSYKITLNL
jgi:hypothetical protein